MGAEASPENVVQETRRMTRRRSAAEEKIRTVREATAPAVADLRKANSRLKQLVAEVGRAHRLGEGADLSVRQTLGERQVPRATFYTWYRRCDEGGLSKC